LNNKKICRYFLFHLFIAFIIHKVRVNHNINRNNINDCLLQNMMSNNKLLVEIGWGNLLNKEPMQTNQKPGKTQDIKSITNC
jgi:hypothetical protein